MQASSSVSSQCQHTKKRASEIILLQARIFIMGSPVWYHYKKKKSLIFLLLLFYILDRITFEIKTMNLTVLLPSSLNGLISQVLSNLFMDTFDDSRQFKPNGISQI